MTTHIATSAVLHLHMTAGMGFGERFYGQTLSLGSLASIVASVAYVFYCRRVPMIAPTIPPTRPPSPP